MRNKYLYKIFILIGFLGSTLFISSCNSPFPKLQEKDCPLSEAIFANIPGGCMGGLGYLVYQRLSLNKDIVLSMGFYYSIFQEDEKMMKIKFPEDSISNIWLEDESLDKNYSYMGCGDVGCFNHDVEVSLLSGIIYLHWEENESCMMISARIENMKTGIEKYDKQLPKSILFDSFSIYKE